MISSNRYKILIRSENCGDQELSDLGYIHQEKSNNSSHQPQNSHSSHPRSRNTFDGDKNVDLLLTFVSLSSQSFLFRILQDIEKYCSVLEAVHYSFSHVATLTMDSSGNDIRKDNKRGSCTKGVYGWLFDISYRIHIIFILKYLQ